MANTCRVCGANLPSGCVVCDVCPSTGESRFVRINASGVREIFLNDCEWKDLLILLTDKHDVEMPSKFSSYGCVSLETCSSAEYLKSLSLRTPRKMVGRSGTIHDECPDCRGEGCTVAADAAQEGEANGG